MNTTVTKPSGSYTIRQDDWQLMLLYFAQSLPMGITWLGLPPWLRTQDVPLETIGFTAICILPWAFKFLWAARIERLSMRNGCTSLIFAMQVLGAIAFGLLVFINLVEHLLLGLVGLFILNCICATQDIATDRYAILYRGAVGAARVNIARFIGFTLGMLAGGNGMLLIVPKLGWGTFAIICAIVMLCIGITSLSFNELAQKHQEQPSPIGLRAFLKQTYAWRLLSIAFLFKISHAFSDSMIKSFWVDQDISIAKISLFTSINLIILGGLGAPLAGWLILRNKTKNDIKACSSTESQQNNYTRKVAIFFGLCSALILVFLGLYRLATQYNDIIAGFYWLDVTLPMLLALTDGAASLAFLTLFMRWSVGSQPGTTFTLFLCAESLGATAFAMLSGIAANYLDYAGHFMLVGLLSALAMFYAHKLIVIYTRFSEANHV